MAFSLATEHTGNSGTSPVQTQTTDSQTPAANSLFLVFVSACEDNNATNQTTNVFGITAGGGGLTYTKEIGDTSWPGASSLSAYQMSTAMWSAPVGGSPPAAFTITIDPEPSASTGWFIAIEGISITGHDTADPFAQAVVSNAASKATGNAESHSISLGSAPTVGNLVVVAFGSFANSGGGLATPTGYTALVNRNTSLWQWGIFYRTVQSGDSATVSCSDLGQAVGGVVAVIAEIAAAAGGNVTVTPTAGAATGTGYGAAASRANAAGTGAATATGYTAAVRDSTAPSAGSATGTGYAATIAERVAASAGAATGTGYNATAQQSGGNITVTPTAGQATTNKTNVVALVAAMAPAAGAATGTGYAATLAAAVVASAGQAAGTGYDATPQQSGGNITVSPAAGAATGTGYAATVAELAAASAGSATGTGYAAAVRSSAAIGAGSATATGYAAAVAETVVCGVGQATATGYNATPTTTGISVSAGAGSATAAGYDATVAERVAPTAGAGTVTGYAATVSVSRIVTPTAGAATGTGYAVTISLAVAPTAGAATGTGYNATVVTVVPGGSIGLAVLAPALAVSWLAGTCAVTFQEGNVAVKSVVAGTTIYVRATVADVDGTLTTPSTATLTVERDDGTVITPGATATVSTGVIQAPAAIPDDWPDCTVYATWDVDSPLRVAGNGALRVEAQAAR